MEPDSSRSRLRTPLQLIAAALTGCVIALIVGVVVILNARQDLSVWHLADLDEEFTVASNVSDFASYLELEARLFRQLDVQVTATIPVTAEYSLNRFSRTSLSNPDRWATNWNRSFEWRHSAPRAGVLLLHGLSDSPYSMRAIATSLHRSGANVIAMRMPGHGTAPSGLLKTRWQDMSAAVRIAARHLRDTTPDAPLYVVGYSNGGALAINFALDALRDDALPRMAGIVLISPEIGVASAAAFAAWQGRLGRVLGLEKLAWNDILPEYDPFKYGSFAINAGDLAYRITQHIDSELAKLAGNDLLKQLPPILAFQSGVDATVTPAALIHNLFNRLDAGRHELVLFDINRLTEIGIFLEQDPKALFEPLAADSSRHYDLTLITNESGDSHTAIATTLAAGSNTPSHQHDVGEWPAGVYSLSHVALPISPDDPVYGGPDAEDSPGVQLGNLSFRGERGVLQVSGTAALRLRWNPFFDYIEMRTLQFMRLDSDAAD
ncbi:MAG: alpha/beta fold hydrolase [Pseudomonadota bacterium]